MAIRKETRRHGETNDCTVKAIAITTGRTYADCHAAMRAAGRKNRKGSSISAMVSASKALGYHMTKLQRTSRNAKTMRTIERDSLVGNGRFVISMSRHVAAIVDGKTIDHTEGRLNRIQGVYSMTPINGFTPPPAKPRGKMPAGSAKWQSFSKYTKHDQLPLI